MSNSDDGSDGAVAVSLMVIMFEPTRGLEYIVPLIAAAVTIAVMIKIMIVMVLLQCHWW